MAIDRGSLPAMPSGTQGNTSATLLLNVILEILEQHTPYVPGMYRWLDLGTLDADLTLTINTRPTIQYPVGHYMVCDWLAMVDPIGRTGAPRVPMVTNPGGADAHTHTINAHDHNVDRLPLGDPDLVATAPTFMLGLQPNDTVLVVRHEPGTPIVVCPVRFSA